MKTFTNLAHRAFKKCASLGTINKKRYYLFIITMFLTLGVGNAWAEDYSIKFLTAATDGSTEIATSTKTSTVLESASCAYVTGFTNNCTKAYYKGKSGVKLSSKNAAGTIELTLSNTCNQNISKVVFKTVKYSSDVSTLTFYAGTSTLGTIEAGSDFSHTFTTPQSVSTLKIASSKRAYISEIIISISSGETTDPTLVTISLDKTELSLQAGATETLTATVTGSTESVTWSSSATGVASVDNTGKVTAVAAGNATITAAIGDVKATCDVTVTAATTPEEPGTGGETTTVTYVLKDDPNHPANSVDWLSGTIDQYTGWTATKGGSNNPKYYDTGSGLRVYNGGKFTITSTKVMTSITLTFAGTNYTFSTSNTTNPQTVTPNEKSYEWSVGRTCRLQKIEITYAADAGGSGETVPSLTIDQFSWSATTATATLPNTFDNPPTLTNKESLAVSYSSSKEDVATIGENGNVTLVGKGETIISATAGDDETYKKTTVSYTLTVKPAPLAPIAGGVIDILNQGWTGVTGTNYTDVAAKTAENEGHSNAQYVAQCAGDKSSIQLRSNNNNSGVVSTISGGIVKRVEVEWQNETTAGRILQVYGSNTAYEAATDLYSDDKKGELLGEITMGGDETVVDYSQWTGDYKYIGFRSKSGAMYLTTITITWLPINSKVTIDGAIQNGSVSVTGATDLNAVAAGTVLTLDNTPKAGYKFVKYNVYKTDEPTTEIDVKNSKFTMPEYDVTVSATFTSIKELDKIEVNTTNVKKTFWQGEAFSSDGLEVTAYYTDGTSAEVTPTNITGGNTANAGEITVTVSYTEGSNTKTTTYNITVKAIENNETTVYTVAQAREIIDAVGNTTVEVYVQGIVSKIVTAFNPNYGNISYDISADGLKTSDQLQAYRGFSYDGAWFTSADDIQVGDVVIVKGKLKIHNTTYELDEGNQLVKLERSDEPKPTAATLPFEFDGNKDDIADVVGMSQTGLGTYDSSPKLKFDTENDNVIIHFDSEPGEFSFLLKQNGSSVGSFTVYESANGEDYTSVWLGGDLGGNGKSTTIKPTLSATSRYVKFEYTTKPSGTNYGLGSISIAKPDLRQEAGIAWSAESTTITIGDAFTAPTLSNPKELTLSCTSDNEDLATVTNAGVVTLKEGVTGKAVITATFAGNETYKPAEVTTTIIVNPKTGDVVILAKHQGKWYAMKAEYVPEETDRLAAVPVYYVNGKLYNVSEEDKAAITWTRSAYGDNTVSFQNNGKYLKGKSSTTLILEEDEDGLYKWNAADNTMLIEGTTRTFLYHKNGMFRNYSITLARETSPTYSDLPVVTAPEFATGNVYTINASATNGTAKGADTYVEGSTVTLMADPAMNYTFVNWTVGGAEVSTANPYVFTASKDLELVANFAEISQTSNTLSGTFSVGEHEVAQFATGNLQYNVKDKKWSFAKQQYQYIGDANINVGDPDFTGTIDLFGWSNGENNNFGANPSGNKNDYKGEFVDWGKLFPAEDNWSTLSHEQWDYLLNERGAGKKQIARVGTVFGVMLFPDVWEMPSGISVTAVYDDYFKVNIYDYTLDQWTKLEKAGAVFFPAAGRRYGGYGNKYIYDGITNLGDEYKLQYCTNDLAAYYTSTKHNDGERVSYLLNLGNGGAKYSTLELGWYEYGHVGQSVRLAKVTSTAYTRNVTNKYGTICLPYASASTSGATFFEVVGQGTENGNPAVYLASVTTLKAGVPYIFEKTETANQIKVVYTGAKENAPVNTGANGLVGTFDDETVVDEGNYILLNNEFRPSDGTAKVNANRAYLDLNAVTGGKPQPMPGRRYIGMSVQGENEATGFDNIQLPNANSQKLIINGQLIIIRNGEKFNAQGQKL